MLVLTMIKSDPRSKPHHKYWYYAMAPMRVMGYAAAVAVLILVMASRATPEAAARGPAGVAAPGYLKSLEDIPLMAGLTERPNSGIAFETPAGRIIEAEAWSSSATELTPNAVLAFYRASLVALGWKVLGAGRFAREGEILRIFTRAGAKGLEVRFSLRPK